MRVTYGVALHEEFLPKMPLAPRHRSPRKNPGNLIGADRGGGGAESVSSARELIFFGTFLINGWQRRARAGVSFFFGRPANSARSRLPRKRSSRRSSLVQTSSLFFRSRMPPRLRFELVDEVLPRRLHIVENDAPRGIKRTDPTSPPRHGATSSGGEADPRTRLSKSGRITSEGTYQKTSNKTVPGVEPERLNSSRKTPFMPRRLFRPPSRTD